MLTLKRTQRAVSCTDGCRVRRSGLEGTMHTADDEPPLNTWAFNPFTHLRACQFKNIRSRCFSCIPPEAAAVRGLVWPAWAAAVTPSAIIETDRFLWWISLAIMCAYASSNEDDGWLSFCCSLFSRWGFCIEISFYHRNRVDPETFSGTLIPNAANKKKNSKALKK